MAKPFPEIIDIDDAMRCCRLGMLASLAFAALGVIGVAVAVITGGGQAVTSMQDGMTWLAGTASAEIVIALVAAWRFRRNRGLIAGSILLLVFLFEFIGKFFIGFPGVFGIVIHLFIGIGIINGIRGAIAMRNTDTLDSEALAREFE
ncbi:hypothetical protein [Sphingomonas sanxanigenens]|uniref:Uncharacterized protein n=1 Tax=Sphingomonas sanxanigenens DSM 19645 = NX02 TaxID=1123269 RepID=W0A8M5_9SPHN|nr:hypothetical protein [Sphingomonas sanxanigenens]AHE52683.1 hypothetical protein NX02_04705 [Sphingomonas sanxanigenens DSM 19645 = NX02]